MCFEEFDTVITLGYNNDAEVTVQYYRHEEYYGGSNMITAIVVNVLVFEDGKYVPLDDDVIARLKETDTWQHIEDAAQEHATS